MTTDPFNPDAVSMNAFPHGLTAKTLILQNEDPGKFDYLQPTNPIEVDLVADMVAARWRLRRIWRFETAMIDIEMDSQDPDFEKRGGAAFSAPLRYPLEQNIPKGLCRSSPPSGGPDCKTNPRNRQNRV